MTSNRPGQVLTYRVADKLAPRQLNDGFGFYTDFFNYRLKALVFTRLIFKDFESRKGFNVDTAMDSPYCLRRLLK